jgi:hypothetical protein
MNIGSQALALGALFLSSKIALSTVQWHAKLQTTLSYKTRRFDCYDLHYELIQEQGQRILFNQGSLDLPCLYPNILKSNDSRLDDLRMAFFSIVQRCEIGACP